MKKLSLIALLALVCLTVAAQANPTGLPTLSKIEQAGKQIKNITATFKEEAYSAVAKKTTTLDGTLYFNNTNMAMKYNKAEAKDLVINGSMFYMRQNKKSLRVNTDENYSIRQLRNTLVYCMQGKLQQLAEDQGLAGKQAANIITTEDSKHYIITLVSRQKDSYYSKIVLHYEKENCRLVKMRTERMGGDYTIYTISNINEEADIDAAVFTIPAKSNASANKSR
ncbi:MAG: outer membrane lipoprotein carrier protein LolA [Bacteroidales bacterium]|nr:outer membrane lipoprotein carrier protein LolA [Bacteroidales bacterium]